MEQSSSSSRHFVIVGVLVVISTIIMNALLQWALPLPVQASLQAINIDWLFGLHVLLIAFLFSLVVVFMIYALVVFRRREGDEGDGEHFEGNTKLEIAWTTAPMIFVIIFSILGVVSLNEVTRAHDDEVTVKIVGQQWQFLFYYGMGDEEPMELDGIPRQELVLAVNRPAIMKMRSKDVLHAFWVPAFRVKQDLVPSGPVHAGEEPDYPTEVRFVPTEVGTYRLRCAELCGGTHYSMLAYVYVVEDAEYEQFLAGEDIVCIVDDVAHPQFSRRCG